MTIENINQVITCPECGAEIPLTDALTKHIEKDLRKRFQQEYSKRLKDNDEKLREELKNKYDSEYSSKLNEMQKQLDQKDSKISELSKRESEIKAREEALLKKEREIDSRVEEETEKKLKTLEEKYKAKEAKSAEKIKQELKDEYKTELAHLRESLNSKSQKLEEANQREAELLKKQRELEDKERELELKVERTLAEERKNIYDKATREIENNYKLKERDKDQLIERYKKQVEDLSRKLESSSQQQIGESQELELEAFLNSQFIYDDIKPVPKGMSGADIIQTVKTQFGHECGKIIWESKRTKNWSDGWISKLKEDLREARADIPVIVSQALPEGVNNIGLKDGVWIVSFDSVYGATALIREQLIQLDRIKTTQVGKNQKMEAVYDYLCSPEFAQKMDGIIEAFKTMKNDLEMEKRAFQRQWSKREKQLENVIKNTAGMYGDLQGLAGAALPTIETLELPEASEDPFKIEKETNTQNEDEDLPF